MKFVIRRLDFICFGSFLETWFSPHYNFLLILQNLLPLIGENALVFEEFALILEILKIDQICLVTGQIQILIASQCFIYIYRISAQAPSLLQNVLHARNCFTLAVVPRLCAFHSLVYSVPAKSGRSAQRICWTLFHLL